MKRQKTKRIQNKERDTEIEMKTGREKKAELLSRQKYRKRDIERSTVNNRERKKERHKRFTTINKKYLNFLVLLD